MFSLVCATWTPWGWSTPIFSNYSICFSEQRQHLFKSVFAFKKDWRWCWRKYWVFDLNESTYGFITLRQRNFSCSAQTHSEFSGFVTVISMRIQWQDFLFIGSFHFKAKTAPEVQMTRVHLLLFILTFESNLFSLSYSLRLSPPPRRWPSPSSVMMLGPSSSWVPMATRRRCWRPYRGLDTREATPKQVRAIQ